MSTPNTLRMDDGFSTLVTMENLPNVKLYEKDVTPPSITMGGPIETTTMRNSAWRTAAPRQLKTMGQISATYAYATVAYGQIMSQIGVNQRIDCVFPDQSRVQFWGWLESFTPSQHKEGDQPTAVGVFHPSNRNTAGDETPPEYESDAEHSGHATET